MDFPDKFYKYTSADATIAILTNSSFKWSSPLNFNDPFDVPRELLHNISTIGVAKAITEILYPLHIDEEVYLENIQPEIKEKIVKFRDLFKTRSIREEKAKALFQHVIQREEDPSLIWIKEYWSDMLKYLRILCLTESPRHVAMWYHYAEKYTGAVIEITPDKEDKGAWSIAKPIIYSDSTSEIDTDAGWATLALAPLEESLSRVNELCLYRKSTDWAYEKEWRIHSFVQEKTNALESYYNFDKQEISSIFLGPNIAPEKADKIEKIVKSQYKNCKIKKTIIGKGALEFSQASP
ncbi:TPA: DUF2971 domain-containing protein [Pseudomonas aeruginosa]|uniref:DUF2971 domain-containing protein n=1 Tax=Pseudomonas aeruginosa TaxID=287 RepID=UPI0010688860|nr:DUF2971 domain-containing protein [Pseudomonas aeruginosa]EKX2040200.1 DUF2971 domain-containing protein [Pseudomonas aeruginosa]MBG5212115.1 DUF2971 domain-containing protein [Pseudomonas aeruginosa]MCS7591034.1 DUF2971 domain-containing protein [Pseudomonas aeruginosa]MED5005428.1 DUF2971 domain-containing protein [Pseudomonas aeruginosa]TEB83140.1 DUF2971 domain-containing protein [Pseudomonas aeruginosa]